MPANTKNITHQEGRNIIPKQTEAVPRENCPGWQFCDILTTPMSAAFDYNLRCSDQADQTGKVGGLADMQMEIDWWGEAQLNDNNHS